MSQSFTPLASSQSSQSTQKSIEPREKGTELSQEQLDRRRHRRKRNTIEDRPPRVNPLPQRRFSTAGEKVAVLAYFSSSRVYAVRERDRKIRLLKGMKWEWGDEKKQWWRPLTATEASQRYHDPKRTIRDWWKNRSQYATVPATHRRMPSRRVLEHLPSLEAALYQAYQLRVIAGRARSVQWLQREAWRLYSSIYRDHIFQGVMAPETVQEILGPEVHEETQDLNQEDDTR
jgi:hypothetical protein